MLNLNKDNNVNPVFLEVLEIILFYDLTLHMFVVTFFQSIMFLIHTQITKNKVYVLQSFECSKNDLLTYLA